MIELKKWRDLYAVVVDGEIVKVNTLQRCKAYIKKIKTIQKREVYKNA